MENLQDIMAVEMNKMNGTVTPVAAISASIPASTVSNTPIFGQKIPQTNLAYKIAKSLIESKMIELKSVDELFKIVEKIETLL